MGRWWQIDPEVEQFEAWSPYNSNLYNPIRYEDKEGDCPTCLIGAVVGVAYNNNGSGSAIHQATQATIQLTQETLEATGIKMSDEGRKSKHKTETKAINNELYKISTGTRYE